MEVSNLFLRFVDIDGETHYLNPRHIQNISTVNRTCYGECEGSTCMCKVKTSLGYGSGYCNVVDFTEDIGEIMESISKQLEKE